MSLAVKLQLKGRRVRIINPPSGFEIDAPISKDSGEAILLFALDAKALNSSGKPFFDAAKTDKLAWIAYPKGGQLGTDLDRDSLWKMLAPMGIRPVRQVSIDSTWSALRFRPGAIPRP